MSARRVARVRALLAFVSLIAVSLAVEAGMRWH
jgi:hypothetical protein